jgi:hypothetical protein
MGLDDLAAKAKQVIAERGGSEALKEDATEVKDDLGREGSLTEKARKAAEDLKDPGASGT